VLQVDKILKVIPRDRKTFLFSATMTKKVRFAWAPASSIRNDTQTRAGNRQFRARLLHMVKPYPKPKIKKKKKGIDT
jgi:superfamily II DNA/RNA helicase